jgi:hypothetical protein
MENNIFSDLDLSYLKSNQSDQGIFNKLDYLLYGPLWDHYIIKNIGFRYHKKLDIFETKLYCVEPITNTSETIIRWLTVYELNDLYNYLNISKPDIFTNLFVTNRINKMYIK